MATQLWEMGLMVCASFFNGTAPLFLKKGVNKYNRLNKNIYLGFCVYALSYVISIPAFRGGDVSVLYPFMALTYIWMAIFSMKYLNEKMNLLKWLGIISIMIGISFIGFGR